MIKRTFLGLTMALATLMSACGGGGGTTAGTMNNTVSIGSTTVQSGSNTTINAKASMRGYAPTSMVWSISPLSTLNTGDAVVTITGGDCAAATYVPPPTTNASGTGECAATLVVPFNVKTSAWRVTNTASEKSAGSISDSITINVTSLPASGFQLVGGSSPLTGYVNKPLTLTIPFTANAGSTVSNVAYKWTEVAGNPETLVISGADSSTATVLPTKAGQYQYSVTVNALVNGVNETASSTVVSTVYPATVVDVINAGVPQLVSVGSVVTLAGTYANPSLTEPYTTTWTQLPGTAGGPAPVTVLNANSLSANFLAPSTIGTYGFELKLTKTLANGSVMVTTAQTSVSVMANAVGAFTVLAGDIQSVAPGTITKLTGSVGAQGTSTGVTYSYLWSQVGSTPAAVTLSNAGTPIASFVPSVAGTYTFNLTVTAMTATGSTTVIGTTQVISTSTSTAQNFAITADAGIVQSVSPNEVATLAGSQTSQGSVVGVTYAYQWVQIGDTPAALTLSNASTASATFIPTVSGVYSFTLTVTATMPDGTTRVASSDTQVVVGGIGNTFSVSAGDAQSVTTGSAATMVSKLITQGMSSGTIYTYDWSQVGASPASVVVSNASTPTASFAPTVTGTYTFLLSVTAVQGGVSMTQTAQTQVLVKGP